MQGRSTSYTKASPSMFPKIRMPPCPHASAFDGTGPRRAFSPWHRAPCLSSSSSSTVSTIPPPRLRSEPTELSTGPGLRRESSLLAGLRFIAPGATTARSESIGIVFFRGTDDSRRSLLARILGREAKARASGGDSDGSAGSPSVSATSEVKGRLCEPKGISVHSR